jgi:hypothetical protein
MKPKLLLCLALVLSGVLVGCATHNTTILPLLLVAIGVISSEIVRRISRGARRQTPLPGETMPPDRAGCNTKFGFAVVIGSNIATAYRRTCPHIITRPGQCLSIRKYFREYVDNANCRIIPCDTLWKSSIEMCAWFAIHYILRASFV